MSATIAHTSDRAQRTLFVSGTVLLALGLLAAVVTWVITDYVHSRPVPVFTAINGDGSRSGLALDAAALLISLTVAALGLLVLAAALVRRNRRRPAA